MNKRNSHILIIDDDHLYCMALEEILSQKGYQVSKCYTVQKGISLLKKNVQLYDLIILDQVLPELSGIIFLEQFNRIQIDKLIPVIILTSHISQENTKKAMSLGAAAALSKPAEPNMILDVVKKTLKENSIN